MVANVTVRQLTPIDAIANSYTARLAELNPILATEAGIAGHDHQLPDLSPDGLSEVTALARRTLAELAATPSLDQTDEVTKAALTDRLELHV